MRLLYFTYMKCAQCDKETINPRFCSLKCSTTYQMAEKFRNEPIPSKECRECKKAFTYGTRSGTKRTSRNKFCSRSCSATYNNRGKAKNASGSNGSTTKRIRKPCEVCGKATPNARFCSQICRSSDSVNQLAAFVAGDSAIACDKHGMLKKWAKSWLLEQAEYRCSLCKWGERHPIDGLPLVQVDHIDGDATNNGIGNLRVLCPNCHSMTPHFGARNIGNGRQHRVNVLYNMR